jgi:large subunit ribosomal protein L9
MEVILTKEVANLGKPGDLVKVNRGYANNYLIPKGLAVLATPGSLKQWEERKANLAKKEALIKAQMEETASQISGKTVLIKAKAGQAGRLFGSVTALDVVKAIKEQLKLDIDKRKLELPEPIKEPGHYDLNLKLHPEVKAVDKLEVQAVSG